MNTRTLLSRERLIELELALNDTNWDILGVCEVRREGERIEDYGKFLLYHIGETSGQYGVGFVIKGTHRDSIIEFIGISERIAVLNITLQGYKDPWTIIQVYSPTEPINKEKVKDVEKFYAILNTTIKEHAHNNLVVMGDFNAQIGTRQEFEDIIIGPYTEGKRNTNGERLVQFAFEHNLSILNSQFKKPANRKWTWISPSGETKNEIDFILTNKPKHFNDIKVLSKFNFYSDHRMVNSHLKSTPHRTSRKNYHASHRKIKTSELQNIDDNLQNLLLNYERQTRKLTFQERYNQIELTFKPNDKKQERNKPNKPLITEKIAELLAERKNLLCINRKDKKTRSKIAELSRNIREKIRKEREYRKREIIEEHIIKTGGIKKAYKTLIDKKNWIPKLKDRTGNDKTARRDILNIATEFYQTLYTRKMVGENTNLQIDKEEIPDILVREVEKALASQKQDKSPGPDNISNEVLLHTKTTAAKILTTLFNEVMTTENIPTQWTESKIVLLHKKGDIYNINNYRPISLMSNIYKIFAKVILRRLTRVLDDNQPIEQAGFRSGFSVMDHLHVVKQVIEKYKEYNLPLYCSFVDYNKAFDSLEHDMIWQALMEQNVENKYIRIIKNVYTKSSARIWLEKLGGLIQIERGVRQGDPLSPKLFSATLERVFRQLNWDNIGIVINGSRLTHLRFADDVVLFSETPSVLQEMLEELVRESAKVGLTMNADKTKLLTNSEKVEIKVMNKTIEYQDEYIYLGQVISTENLHEKEINRRLANSWKRYWSLKEVMKNEEFSIKLKRKLYESCVLPVLTYGCQTWALTNTQLRKLSVCQRAMERSMLGVRRRDRKRNTEIRRETKVTDAIFKIKTLKWRWAGHTLRGIDKWSQRVTVWYPRTGTRNRGRQYKRWKDDIEATGGKLWSRSTTDRGKWKELEEAYAKGHTENKTLP